MRIAVYAGSFDPPTMGHKDIIQRASMYFDKLIVVIGVNPAKTPLLKTEKRIEAVKKICGDISRNWVPNCDFEVYAFSGLIVDFAREHNATAIVRGLRPNGDFENEFQLAMGNKDLAPDINTVWLSTCFEHSHVSSSLVKQVLQMGHDDRWKKWVPEEIRRLVEKELVQPKVDPNTHR